MGSTDGFIAYALHSYNFSSMQFLWHRAVFLYVFASFFLYVDVFLQILLHRFTEAINMEGIMISFVKKGTIKCIGPLTAFPTQLRLMCNSYLLLYFLHLRKICSVIDPVLHSFSRSALIFSWIKIVIVISQQHFVLKIIFANSAPHCDQKYQSC